MAQSTHDTLWLGRTLELDRLRALNAELLSTLRLVRVWVLLAASREDYTGHVDALQNASDDLRQLDAVIARAEGK